MKAKRDRDINPIENPAWKMTLVLEEENPNKDVSSKNRL